MTEKQDFPHRAGIEIGASESDQPDAVASLHVDESHMNANGTLHGGVIATMCDTVMGAAIRAALDGDQKAATVSLTVTYMAPAELGDTIVANAEVRKQGKKIVIAEADVVRQGDDEAIAHAVATFSTISA